MRRFVATAMAFGMTVGMAGVATAQDASRVPSPAWNRYYTHGEINDLMRRIAAARPDIVELQTIGRSIQGREMIVAVVTNRSTGEDTDKPGMWIDGNVHGNEIQAAEVVLYTLWKLAAAHGENDRLTELVDRASFYLLPSVNPDGRDYWFEEANTPHSSRHNQRPYDNDRDGLLDEDPYDDIDGDGHITYMWKQDPNGDWNRSQTDPRVFVRVEPGEKGSWRWLGQEGIDNDGDGDINEDGPFTDDMNRNWPSDWQPQHIQYGAGEFPLSSPETLAIADFMLTKPNLMTGQSYHNTGGMILRGPGQSSRADFYPAGDRRVYDELGRIGEEMLPFYEYMVLFSDLYPVHGGFVNWMGEGLGMYAFTNELWSSDKYFQRESDEPMNERMWTFRDHVAFGEMFTDYTEHEHPQYGTVLVGGPNKWSSRNTPTFMLEEECHRNFAFTMLHADAMAEIGFGRVEVERLGGGLWSVTAEVRNERLMPTRSALQADKRIGLDDTLVCEVDGGRVVAAGELDSWDDRWMDEFRHEPGRLTLREGIGGRDGRIFRFIVESGGGGVTLRYSAERARDAETAIDLE